MADHRTIDAVIRRLLPGGTAIKPGFSADGDPDWSKCPEWPADVFAVAATLVEQSDCHTCLGADIGNPEGIANQLVLNDKARSLGRKWADTLGVPKAVQKYGMRYKHLAMNRSSIVTVRSGAATTNRTRCGTGSD